jgi:hypothetical protein
MLPSCRLDMSTVRLPVSLTHFCFPPFHDNAVTAPVDMTDEEVDEEVDDSDGDDEIAPGT